VSPRDYSRLSPRHGLLFTARNARDSKGERRNNVPSRSSRNGRNSNTKRRNAKSSRNYRKAIRRYAPNSGSRRSGKSRITRGSGRQGRSGRRPWSPGPSADPLLSRGVSVSSSDLHSSLKNVTCSRKSLGSRHVQLRQVQTGRVRRDHGRGIGPCLTGGSRTRWGSRRSGSRRSRSCVTATQARRVSPWFITRGLGAVSSAPHESKHPHVRDLQEAPRKTNPSEQCTMLLHLVSYTSPVLGRVRCGCWMDWSMWTAERTTLNK